MVEEKFDAKLIAQDVSVQHANKTTSNKSTIIFAIVSVALILLVGAHVAYVSFLTSTYKKEFADMQQNLATLQTALQQNEDNIQDYAHELDKAQKDTMDQFSEHGFVYRNLKEMILANFQPNIDYLSQELTTLQNKINNPSFSQVVPLSAIAKILQLAKMHLDVLKNPTVAEQLLTTANHFLASQESPTYNSLRESIVENKRILAAIKMPDKNEIWKIVDILLVAVAKYPTKTTELKVNAITTPEGDNVATPAGDWRATLKSTWTELKALIKIKRYDADDPAKFMHGEAMHRDQLRLLFEYIRWSGLRDQAFIYQHSIVSAKQLLVDYFDVDSNLVKQAIESLDTLAAIEISPTMPSLANSCELIETLLKAES